MSQLHASLTSACLAFPVFNTCLSNRHLTRLLYALSSTVQFSLVCCVLTDSPHIIQTLNFSVKHPFSILAPTTEWGGSRAPSCNDFDFHNQSVSLPQNPHTYSFFQKNLSGIFLFSIRCLFGLERSDRNLLVRTIRVAKRLFNSQSCSKAPICQECAHILPLPISSGRWLHPSPCRRLFPSPSGR